MYKYILFVNINRLIPDNGDQNFDRDMENVLNDPKFKEEMVDFLDSYGEVKKIAVEKMLAQHRFIIYIDMVLDSHYDNIISKKDQYGRNCILTRHSTRFNQSFHILYSDKSKEPKELKNVLEVERRNNLPRLPPLPQRPGEYQRPSDYLRPPPIKIPKEIQYSPQNKIQTMELMKPIVQEEYNSIGEKRRERDTPPVVEDFSGNFIDALDSAINNTGFLFDLEGNRVNLSYSLFPITCIASKTVSTVIDSFLVTFVSYNEVRTFEDSFDDYKLVLTNVRNPTVFSLSQFIKRNRL